MDPLFRKYPYLSSYCFVGNSPIIYVDIDGKEIVDPQGNKVSITRNSDGSLSFSKNATKDIIRVANALNLTATGRAQLRTVLQSDIHVKIVVSPQTIINKTAEGTEATLGETVQGNYKESDNYGKKVNPDGTYGITEATITIYEGTVTETTKTGSGFDTEGLTTEQAIGAVAGHEIVHATNKVEIDKDLKHEQKYGKARPKKAREAVPEQIENKIIAESKLLKK